MADCKAWSIPRPRTSKDRSATLWLPGRREGGVRWRWCLVSGFQNQKNCESPTRPQKLKLNPGSSRQMASELGRLIWNNWPSGWKYGIIWYVQIEWLCYGIIWIDLIDFYLFIYLYLYLFSWPFSSVVSWCMTRCRSRPSAPMILN